MKEDTERTRDETGCTMMEACGNDISDARKVSLSPVSMFFDGQEHDRKVLYTDTEGTRNVINLEDSSDFEMNHYNDADQEQTDIDNTDDSGQEMNQDQKRARSDRNCANLEIARKLEATLLRIRATTKTFLSAVKDYTNEIESIELDYASCRASQHKEFSRLQDVAPDVSMLASAFLSVTHANK